MTISPRNNGWDRAHVVHSLARRGRSLNRTQSRRSSPSIAPLSSCRDNVSPSGIGCNPISRGSSRGPALQVPVAQATAAPLDGGIARAIINQDNFVIRVTLTSKSAQTILEKSLTIPVNDNNANSIVLVDRNHLLLSIKN